MRQLNFDLKLLQERRREGGFVTRRDRSYALAQAANTLHDLGFRRLRAAGLRRKHVDALVREWRRRGLSTGTLKNRMAHLRWWARHIDRAGRRGDERRARHREPDLRHEPRQEPRAGSGPSGARCRAVAQCSRRDAGGDCPDDVHGRDDSLDVVDGGSARNEHRVGRPRGGDVALLDAGRGVHHREVDALAGSRLEYAR